MTEDDPNKLILQLGGTVICLIAVAYPLAIASAAFLAFREGWHWYEWLPVAMGILWSVPLIWGAWEAGRVPEGRT